MRLSLPTQLRIIAGLFLVMAVTGATVVFRQLTGMSADGRVVNYAGIVRGGTQRLVKLELAGRKNEKLSGRLDGIIRGLVRGDAALGLPRAVDRDFLARMAEVESGWRELRRALASGRTGAAWTEDVMRLSESFFDTTDRAVSAAETFAAAKVRHLRMAQYALVLLNLGLCLVVAFRFVGVVLRSTRDVVAILTRGARDNREMAAQVAGASQSLAAGCSEQAASLEETSASLEEIASMNRRNCDHAHEVRASATRTLSMAEAGVGEMRELLAAIEGIRNANEAIAGSMASIDHIAAQTHLLGLNAAVEAARAGESGAGFAVVAGEVRALAARSAAAAAETAERLKETASRTQLGVDLSAKVATGLEAILAQVRDMDQSVARIALATEEQSQGVSQVNLAVNQMDRVTQNSAATAQETASASELLQDQAAALRAGVTALAALVGDPPGASVEPEPDPQSPPSGASGTSARRGIRAAPSVTRRFLSALAPVESGR